MKDDDLVTVADCLWPHEAGMMNTLLESAGIRTVVRGALSTSGELPGPVSAIMVKSSDEASARELISQAETIVGLESDPFVCDQCGETAPPGFTICPTCAQPQEVAAPVKGESMAQTWLLFLLVCAVGAIYLFTK